jgi:hypothetical protein
MPIDQHQIDQPLGKLGCGDAGQHLDVGKLIGNLLPADDESTRKLRDNVLEKLRA